MTERREIVPTHLERAGRTMTAAKYDRRALFTEHFAYCRHYQSAESVTRWRASTRLTILRALPPYR